MPLDFCIGRESTPPVFSLQQQMHSQLFQRTDELRLLPQLSRMSRFCADVSYEGASLAALLQELREVIPTFAGRPQMQATLRQLEEICQTAVAQEKGLYGYCD